jgi:hypothetical protein
VTVGSVNQRPPAAFYCMSSGIYFLGAVAMLNSLRLLGHSEAVFLLDCGLSPRQRELIRPHVTLVPGPPDVPPYVLKTIAPLRHPADVMVLIDADMIATRSLADLIAQASHGRVIAARNDVERFVPQWGELLGLGEVRRQPYVSSGLIFLGGPVGEEVLALMDALADRVDLDLTFRSRNDPSYPFLYLEQDVLNGVLASRVDRDRTIALPHRLVPNPPFPGLRLMDETTLRCAYRDGTEPYVLHHFGTKPWLEPARDGAYSRLLRRLLTGHDVAIRVSEEELPQRLRSGVRPWLRRRWVDARETFRWHVREPLGAQLRARGR